MNILLINPYDIYGGAEKIVCQLASIYCKLGNNACIVVSRKFSEYNFVVEVQLSHIKTHHKILSKFSRLYQKEDIIKKILRQIEQPGGIKKIFTGRENTDYIDFKFFIDSAGFIPDIIHFHNLHGDFTGHKLLSSAGVNFPVVITLHDLWFLTGKCIQPGKCSGWKQMCHNCPQAWFPSFLIKKGISKNLKEKIACFSKTRPYVCVPSRWTMEIIEQSYIKKYAKGLSIIHNGVDLLIFKPGKKNTSREKLGLSEQIKIVLTSGRDLKTNRYKNFPFLKKVAMTLGNIFTKTPILFLCLGDKGKSIFYKNIEMRFIPFLTNDNLIADYYRAADVYVTASEYETWGLTITEAMACGIPVVALANSGLREQIINQKTGFLISDNSPEKMANIIKEILENEKIQTIIGEAAFHYAKENFDIEDTARQYLSLYKKILNKEYEEKNRD